MRQLIICLLLLIGLLGCSSNSDEQSNQSNTDYQGSWDYKTGYILKKEDPDKVLVVKYMTPSERKNPSFKKIIKKADPHAVWFTIQNQEQYEPLAVGDKVSIVNNGAFRDSYPGLATATDIKKLD